MKYIYILLEKDLYSRIFFERSNIDRIIVEFPFILIPPSFSNHLSIHLETSRATTANRYTQQW